MAKSLLHTDNAVHERFFVLTGGPGSGKSTLVDAVARLGYGRTLEAGRAIIQHQQAIRGVALPWRDSSLFAELMLCWEMRSYDLALGQPGAVFFDRGVPDVAGYLRLLGLPVPAHVDEAAKQFRYNRCVFVAPPWREIFVQDGERKQDFDEAERTYASMVATYTNYGYEVVVLPKTSLENRLQLVIQMAGLSRGTRS